MASEKAPAKRKINLPINRMIIVYLDAAALQALAQQIQLATTTRNIDLLPMLPCFSCVAPEQYDEHPPNVRVNMLRVACPGMGAKSAGSIVVVDRQDKVHVPLFSQLIGFCHNCERFLLFTSEKVIETLLMAETIRNVAQRHADTKPHQPPEATP